MSVKQKLHPILAPALGVGVVALAFSGLAGLAFAMWIDNGPEMFMTLVEAGLSCF